jgi:hypothetical protein
MGAMLFEQQDYRQAFPLLLEAYRIFGKIGSPNVKAAEGYLGAIVGKVGEAQVKEWLSNS